MAHRGTASPTPADARARQPAPANPPPTADSEIRPIGRLVGGSAGATDGGKGKRAEWSPRIKKKKELLGQGTTTPSPLSPSPPINPPTPGARALCSAPLRARAVAVGGSRGRARGAPVGGRAGGGGGAWAGAGREGAGGSIEWCFFFRPPLVSPRRFARYCAVRKDRGARELVVKVAIKESTAYLQLKGERYGV